MVTMMIALCWAVILISRFLLLMMSAGTRPIVLTTVMMFLLLLKKARLHVETTLIQDIFVLNFLLVLLHMKDIVTCATVTFVTHLHHVCTGVQVSLLLTIVMPLISRRRGKISVKFVEQGKMLQFQFQNFLALLFQWPCPYLTM
uniref:Uncharacterized protein n=1 Tax=Populus davidiana TaxID=266767 RepID=A0A6M2EEN2_9ROSI